MEQNTFFFPCEQTVCGASCTGQAGVCVLLTLLHLGIRNIRLGPTLPAFVLSNILPYLVEHFGTVPASTPEAGRKAMLG